MQKRSLGVLVSVTAVMVALATVALATAPSDTGSAAPGADERALPGLAARLNDVASVEVKRSGLDLTFIRDGNAWLTEQKSNYPADASKVSRIVLALSDMTLVEPKTAEPSLYPRLQVEDPGQGKSTLVTIKDKSGNDIAQLIVGKHSYDRLGEGNDGVYVRKPGDRRSWLARGALDFSDDVPSWLARQIIDIPDSRIAKVVLSQPDGTTLILSRTTPDAKFTLESSPPNAKYKSDTALGEPAMALETLDLDDVQPAAKLPVPGKGITTASYTTFDGLTVQLKLFEHENKSWIAVAATGAGKSAAEAKRLEAQVSPWVYAIPSYKAKMIETKRADLLEVPKGS
jgi:Domain of unknown function (DUF4340)